MRSGWTRSSSLRRGELHLKTYDSLDAVARRLMKTNARLGTDKARWLAHHWSAELAPGQWTILGEAAHKVTSAQLYRVDEVLAIFRNINAPDADGGGRGRQHGTLVEGEIHPGRAP